MPFWRRSAGSFAIRSSMPTRKRVVEALAVAAQPRRVGGGQVRGRLRRHACADVLAARLVVEPEHGEADRLQQVEQVLAFGGAPFERALVERREHARHRVAGVGPARADVAKAEHAGARELGIRLARVAVEREVVGPRRLADDDDDERRLVVARVARPEAAPAVIETSAVLFLKSGRSATDAADVMPAIGLTM
jgi:hypothetical protein